MKKFILPAILLLLNLSLATHAQNVLPEITVKNLNGTVIVSWLNDYTKPLENIIIQRSYDSTGNFKSIGSVLNPQNKENGYPDQSPPYEKMYYRVFIYFENGEYISGPSFKAVSEKTKYKPIDFSDIPEIIEDQSQKIIPEDSSEIEPENEPVLPTKKITQVEIKKETPKKTTGLIDSVKTIQIKKTNEYTYPSSRIYSSKLNNLIIQLPEYSTKKYLIKFFDDSNNFLFEIKKITDDYLILEKSNFIHSGWFYFEIYEDGLKIEKNKFFIGKDPKATK